MHALKLTSLVCFAVVCLQQSNVAAGRMEPGRRGEPERKEKRQYLELGLELTDVGIADLNYVRESTVINGEMQITDSFEFQIPGTSCKDKREECKSVSPSQTFESLLLFDSEEGVWVEAAAKEEQQGNTVTLTKPLIGYDLLKPSGCGEEEFKTQPYTKGRWGYLKEKEEQVQCYMVSVSTSGQSFSQMYPDNCAKREEKIYNDENVPVKAAPYKDFQTSPKGHNIQKSNSFSFEITQFTKTKIGNDRKFVCRVAYTHLGHPTSLGNNFPDADVKVYYRPSNSASWGLLLDLDWIQFSGGINKFVSWVSQQHLNNQGVGWNKCFKCEVKINGMEDRKCRGAGCTCTA